MALCGVKAQEWKDNNRFVRFKRRKPKASGCLEPSILSSLSTFFTRGLAVAVIRMWNFLNWLLGLGCIGFWWRFQLDAWRSALGRHGAAGLIQGFCCTRTLRFVRLRGFSSFALFLPINLVILVFLGFLFFHSFCFQRLIILLPIPYCGVCSSPLHTSPVSFHWIFHILSRTNADINRTVELNITMICQLPVRFNSGLWASALSHWKHFDLLNHIRHFAVLILHVLPFWFLGLFLLLSLLLCLLSSELQCNAMFWFSTLHSAATHCTM